jgi:hypothetical protein
MIRDAMTHPSSTDQPTCPAHVDLAALPPWPARRKRSRLSLSVLGIVLIGLVAVAVVARQQIVAAARELGDNAAGRNAVDAKVGEPARDGTLAFTVTGVRCGVARLGEGALRETAEGELCLIDVAVVNVGRDARTFAGAAQRAFDTGSRDFPYDAAAQTPAGGDRLLREIRPGDRAAGPLVFDVPKGARLASVVLRETPFSAGVRVTLP